MFFVCLHSCVLIVLHVAEVARNIVYKHRACQIYSAHVGSTHQLYFAAVGGTCHLYSCKRQRHMSAVFCTCRPYTSAVFRRRWRHMSAVFCTRWPYMSALFCTCWHDICQRHSISSYFHASATYISLVYINRCRSNRSKPRAHIHNTHQQHVSS